MISVADSEGHQADEHDGVKCCSAGLYQLQRRALKGPSRRAASVLYPSSTKVRGGPAHLLQRPGCRRKQARAAFIPWLDAYDRGEEILLPSAE